MILSFVRQIIIIAIGLIPKEKKINMLLIHLEAGICQSLSL